MTAREEKPEHGPEGRGEAIFLGRYCGDDLGAIPKSFGFIFVRQGRARARGIIE